jgi:hypothetical protein
MSGCCISDKFNILILLLLYWYSLSELGWIIDVCVCPSLRNEQNGSKEQGLNVWSVRCELAAVPE